MKNKEKEIIQNNASKLFLKTEGIYKTVFHNSPLGIVHFDETGTIIDCNEKLSEIVGSSRERLLNISLINDIEDKELINQVRKTLAFGSGYYENYYTAITSGKTSPIIGYFKAIYDGDKIIGGVGIIEDNTDKKAAEERIKESEQYLEEAQKIAHIGHWKRDLITNKLTCSKELFCIYGLDYHEGEVSYWEFANLIHPDDLENGKAVYEESLKNRTEYTADYRLLLNDGRIKYVSERGRTKYRNDGTPILSIGTVQDITELRKKEILHSALFKISNAANSKKTLEELYAEIYDIICELMPANNFYIAIYNEETKLLSFPYHVDEVDETPKTQPFGAGLTEYVLEQKKNVIITEEIDKQLQKEGKIGAGGEFAKIWIGIYLNFESTIKGVMVIQDYHDENAFTQEDIKVLEFISRQVVRAIDKKYSDEKLAKSEKALKKSNADKDKFFSIISHDLKSPFQGLIGMSNLLTENFDELTKDEVVEFNGLLNKSVKNIYSLIEQLLEWSRIQTGRMDYNPQKIKLKDAYLNVSSVALILAHKKRITVKYSIDDDIYVFADLMMVETVLRNLISNAIKFTHENGKIEVVASKVHNSILIHIKDSGVGIADNVQKKLFKIEEHYTSLGTNSEQGTGLGLILCKELIEKNNGKIWVNSKLGYGSTFSFSLPIEEME